METVNKILAVIVILVVLAYDMAREYEKKSPPEPMLLVASEKITQGYFHEAVILVTHLPFRRNIGIMMNRPLTSGTLGDTPQLNGKTFAIFHGGPVAADELGFIAKSAKHPQDAVMLYKDTYFSRDIEFLKKMIKRGNPIKELRLYRGFAGWNWGQLEEEIKRGAWQIAKADVDKIFTQNPQTLWPELIKQVSTQDHKLGAR